MVPSSRYSCVSGLATALAVCVTVNGIPLVLWKTKAEPQHTFYLYGATNISQAMQRKSFSSGTLWESIIDYPPSVRFVDIVYISGTTASDKQGNIVGIDDPYLQTIQIINNIRIALEDRGANLEDIVRTRIYVINIGD